MATKQRTGTETEVVTAAQSLTLTKNLIRASLSSVAYMRNLFPEDCFEKTQVGGLEINKLVGAKNKEASLLIDWLEHGVFDALEKKYLETIRLEVYNGLGSSVQGMKLLEDYIFTLAYPDEVPELSVSQNQNRRPQSKKSKPHDAPRALKKKGDLKSVTTKILRSIIQSTQSLAALPADRTLSVQLLYRDEVTPRDYEPKYFTSDEFQEKLSWFADVSLSQEIGAISSPFHSIQLRVKSCSDAFQKLGPMNGTVEPERPSAHVNVTAAEPSPHTELSKITLNDGKQSILKVRRKSDAKKLTNAEDTSEPQSEKFIERILSSQDVESNRKRKASKVANPISQGKETKRGRT